MIPERVEIGVVFNPFLLAHSRSNRFLQTVDRFFLLTQIRVYAGHVVEGRSVVGIHDERAVCPFHSAFPLPQLAECASAEIEGASVVRMQIQVLFNNLQRATVSSLGIGCPAERNVDGREQGERLVIVGIYTRGLFE
jgi:hypothetical protein